MEYFIEESSIAAEFGILKSLRNEVYRFFQGAKNPYYPQKYPYFGQGSLKYFFPSFINRRLRSIIDSLDARVLIVTVLGYDMSPGFIELQRAL